MQPLQSSTSAWKEVIDGDHQETSISSKLDAEGGEVFSESYQKAKYDELKKDGFFCPEKVSF